MKTMISLVIGFVIVSLGSANEITTDKTLVVWGALDDLTDRGGSLLTLQSGDEFDGIVFGELKPGKWMAGSDLFKRTDKVQDTHIPETAHKAMVQIAIVYEGDGIRIYRNGLTYASYQAKNIDLLSPENNIAVFGLRHVGAGGGRISGASKTHASTARP